MTAHSISYGARTYAWPSIQKASAMLAQRIARAQKLAVVRKNLHDPMGLVA
jgi:hypothetical protein